MSATAAVPPGRLPKKEGETFRSVVHCFETKQFNKGIKHADNILKKFPNHGETLAMKGLLKNCQNKKEEAYELVKLGLRNDVRSHICWHVYGLIHKSDSNYKEASKCFLNALRIDPTNQNILRDLSFLQVQVRDISGFILSRAKIVQTKPGMRSSWVGYSVANFLGGQYNLAYELIAKYYEGVTERSEPYIESELLLFQNCCLQRQGLYKEAIIFLEKHERDIVDRLALRIRLAELIILCGRFNEARARWGSLVSDQTENYRFHCGLQVAYLQLSPEESLAMFALKAMELPCTVLQLTESQLDVLKQLYQGGKFTRSRAARKIYLTLVRGDELRAALEAHIRKNLSDGVPALYQDVCSLIKAPSPVDPSRLQFVKEPVDFREHPVTIIAVEILDRLVRNLKANGTFEDCPGPETVAETPSALLWGLFLRAHLLEMSGDYEGAFAAIDEAIAHTPTALDMLAKKAHMLKKLGSFHEAAETMDHCRSLDLQDRYLNNKTTKYLLRADLIPQAMDTIAMFTKHDGGDPQRLLYEMQCNWYEIELAESYARLKQWGPALKKFYAIREHFTAYVEDMFDFHSFCLRKQTLRVYTEILDMQDRIYSHKFFQRAIRGALNIILHLIDYPEDTEGLGHLSAAERKKEKAKLKKKKDKEQKEQEERLKAAAEAAKREGLQPPKLEDDIDPCGDKLLQKVSLQEASLWCQLIANQVDTSDPETLALACEVNIRRGKFLPALRMLSVGLRKHPQHPDLSLMLVKYSNRVGGGANNVAVTMSAAAPKATMQAVTREELAALMGHGDAVMYANRYAATARSLNSLPHRIGASRCLLAASKAASSKTLAAALLADEEIWEGRGLTVQAAKDAVQVLSSDLKLSAEASLFKERALKKFPWAEFFKPVIATEGGAAAEDGPVIGEGVGEPDQEQA